MNEKITTQYETDEQWAARLGVICLSVDIKPDGIVIPDYPHKLNIGEAFFLGIELLNAVRRCGPHTITPNTAHLKAKPTSE